MNPKNVGKNVEKIIKDNNITIKEISKKMEIKEQELIKKIKGKEKFYISDILSITKILKLSNEEVNHTFFK